MELTDADLVLVAIMPKPRDMEIARLLGWYRIPLKTAPKILRPDLIAFYQTSSFGKSHRSRIEAFAEVRGVELTTRAELFREEREHPRANEEYYKIQIGPVTALEHPILADEWKRFTFFYTTGSRLTRAETIRGLAMNAGERSQLWRTLRERGEKWGSSDKFERSASEEAGGGELPQELFFLLGNLSLSGLDLGGEGRS